MAWSTTSRSMASRPTVPGLQSRARKKAAAPQRADGRQLTGRPGCAQESVGARPALGAHVAPQRSAGLAVSLGQRRTPVGIESAPMRRGEETMRGAAHEKMAQRVAAGRTCTRIAVDDTMADRTGRSLAPADTVARGAGRVPATCVPASGARGQPSPVGRARTATAPPPLSARRRGRQSERAPCLAEGPSRSRSNSRHTQAAVANPAAVPELQSPSL